MKKHIFAFICVFVIMFNTFTYTQTKAMDIGVAIDVGSEILYEGWDMIQSIFNGFIISLGQYAGYADKASAMAAFYNDWGDVLTVLTGGYMSPAEVEQPAIGFNTVMPLDFGMSGAIMRDFIYNYGGFVSDPSLGMYADINQKSIASWNRYNDLFVQKFLDAHNKDIESHPTYPDPDFASYLDVINGTGFDFIKNMPIDSYTGRFNNVSLTYFNFNGVPSNYTWYTYNKNGTDTPWNTTKFSYINSGLFVSEYGIDNIYINKNYNTNLYNCTITKNNLDVTSASYPVAYDIGWSTGDPAPLYKLYGNFYIDNHLFYGGCNPFYSGSWASKSFTTNTLDEMFTELQRYVRNANIYVDGVLWSYVGTTPEPNVTLGIDHPYYDDSGQMIGNDVFFPEQDLKADLVKFTELIDDKILSGESIDLDDLIDAGVLTDAEGNIITDENRDEYIKKKDIATVITDALDDTAVSDLLPDVPDPPPDDPWNWHFPTIVIPEGGDPDPRGTGLSVLARIINVTNQSLPGEVITMFWGICITMLILGIIKILHK